MNLGCKIFSMARELPEWVGRDSRYSRRYQVGIVPPVQIFTDSVSLGGRRVSLLGFSFYIYEFSSENLREQANVSSIGQRCKESCVKSVVWRIKVWGTGPSLPCVFKIYGWKNSKDDVKSWRCESCQLCMNVCWKTQRNIFLCSLASSPLKYQAMWVFPSKNI